MKLARRTEPFQESVIREMTRLGDETGSVNLSQGLPDFDSPPEVLEAAVRAIYSGDNQYTFPFGTPEFRKAIAEKTARYNHILTDPEDGVTVTCGVSEAMMSVIMALTDPEDEVIILEPWYENYLPDCLMAGVRPKFVPMRQPDYTFDPDELRSVFSIKTRLILINTPHNPTGRVFSSQELDTIARLCREFNVIAVTDEIYEYILFDGREHISIGSLPGMEDRTVTISGLGKTYALTGWRVGWAVAHPDLSARIRKVHDYLTICAPSPFQTAGIVALNLPESYYTGLRREYSARRTLLLGALEKAGFSFLKPEGAYYIMANYEKLQWNKGGYTKNSWSLDRAFSEFIAREVGVAVVPGSSFYASKEIGQATVRFNFAKREETLMEAARRLGTHFS
ncbi:MAG: aminotransferase class I/II-fold pyridoxal phosphate-dependent enzyme [Chloroflexi bacterium]|nr:MAG: aminotransferase class I/II-fold pyridoxal phosphate-dependent enzyme [Chloroflexota bacterium]